MRNQHKRRRTAYHEAGHAVAFLVHGVPVERITLNPGRVYPATDCTDPHGRLLVANAGWAAEAIGGFPSGVGHASAADCALSDSAITELGLCLNQEQRRNLHRAAERFVWEYAEAIAYLAEFLVDLSVDEMERHTLAQLCRSLSVLSFAKDVYSKADTVAQHHTAQQVGTASSTHSATKLSTARSARSAQHVSTPRRSTQIIRVQCPAMG